MSRMYPNAGRILTCQCCVLLGLPLSCLVLKGLPTAAADSSGSVKGLGMTYAVAMFILGLSISW